MPFICLISCTRYEEGWSDNIQLSTKVVDFKSKGGDFTVTSKGRFWLIGTTLLGNYMNVPNNNWTTVPYKIVGDWYTVNRAEDKALIVHVDTNTTGKARGFTIHLEDGDYFNSVDVTQSVE
jgi:hypothetical protein